MYFIFNKLLIFSFRMILIIFGCILFCQVPLYKHIADLSGKYDPVLPVPAIAVISGGKHAGNNLALQV